MATYLADTNLLLRLADTAAPQHPVATDALARLIGAGDEVYLTPQNLIEFWAVATRPTEANGFGWTRERTAQEVEDLQTRFPLLTESSEIFTHWMVLVKKLPIHGKRVHDARKVAVLQANRIEHLITFNGSDFNAFQSLSVVDPNSLIPRPSE